jgi:diaminobutyrate-2-oxoglutarate transaminase
MALVLMKPEHDVWEPGEHNGTFRGNNAAFVTATAALEHFWTDDELTEVHVAAKSDKVRAGLESIMEGHPGLFTEVRGRGLILGIETSVPEIAGAIAKGAFERGLIIETAGAEDEVVKLLPPLVVTDEAIDRARDPERGRRRHQRRHGRRSCAPSARRSGRDRPHPARHRRHRPRRRRRQLVVASPLAGR